MKNILLLFVATLTLSCGVSRAHENPAPELLPAHTVVIRGTRTIPSAWTLRSKPATGQHAMVVSAHPLATQAGVEILKQGGNAIDAAVAGDAVEAARTRAHAPAHQRFRARRLLPRSNRRSDRGRDAARRWIDHEE